MSEKTLLIPPLTKNSTDLYDCKCTDCSVECDNCKCINCNCKDTKITSPLSSLLKKDVNTKFKTVIDETIENIKKQELTLTSTTVLTYILKIISFLSNYNNISSEEKKQIVIEVINCILSVSPINSIEKSLIEKIIITLLPTMEVLIIHIDSGVIMLFKKIDEEIEETTCCKNICHKLYSYFFLFN